MLVTAPACHIEIVPTTVTIVPHVSMRAAAGVPAPEIRTSGAGAPPMTGEGKRQAGVAAMEELLLAVANHRSRQAFRSLFEHFAPRLTAFILRQGTDPDLSEEIVQETMVNVWRKAHQFDPARASASTWVFTIARNMRIDLLRKHRRPAPNPDDPAFVPDPDPPAFETLARGQEARGLRDAVAKLPTEQRQVLELAFFEEKSHVAIAEALGLPLGTVKSRIRLALKKIRSDMGGQR